MTIRRHLITAALILALIWAAGAAYGHRSAPDITVAPCDHTGIPHTYKTVCRGPDGTLVPIK